MKYIEKRIRIYDMSLTIVDFNFYLDLEISVIAFYSPIPYTQHVDKKSEMWAYVII
jgi:hypothetical protein